MLTIKNPKDNVGKKEVEDKPHLSLVVDGGHRPLKPGFHLAMVLTLLAQHQPVVSEKFYMNNQISRAAQIVLTSTFFVLVGLSRTDSVFLSPRLCQTFQG